MFRPPNSVRWAGRMSLRGAEAAGEGVVAVGMPTTVRLYPRLPEDPGDSLWLVAGARLEGLVAGGLVATVEGPRSVPSIRIGL
jgi:hypothetical protein